MSGPDKIQLMRYKWQDLCILVVEDNYINSILIEAFLSPTGIKIIHAGNGIKSIDAVKVYPGINLVLMDIQLPFLNGYDALHEIKKMRPELPVIAQTAYAMDDSRFLYLSAGFSDYISKPINRETLLDLINTYIWETTGQ